jgi:dihydrofolate synthase/folylpolyglutamate synthase
VRVITPANEKGWIPKPEFVALMQLLEQYFDAIPGLTWFEIMTAVAFRYFADRQVNIAVVEVGLGGRLDTTNVLLPLVSVITSLSLDHTGLLGDTIAEIAFEKGGIIKSGVPLVCAPQPPEALAVLRDLANKRGSSMTLIGKEWRHEGQSGQLLITSSPEGSFVPDGTPFRLALAGDHQLENGAVALAALDTIKDQFPTITLAAALQGLATVRWDGRLQIVYSSPTNPTFLVDSAHNEDSAAKLKAALLNDYDYDKLWFIFGAPEDKAISQMMDLLFPLAAGVILTAADHPRAASPDTLLQMARERGISALTAATPAESIRQAFTQAASADLICACGSIIFIGDLLNQWDRLKSELTSN